MKNKIKCFVLLFILLFSFSSENLQNNQRILVESTENNKNEDGSVKINLLRMQVNKINEALWRYKIEILYEIDEKNKNDYVYLDSGPYECNEPNQYTHKIKRITNGTNGEKLILVEDVLFAINLMKLNICLIEYNEISEIEEKVDLSRLKGILVDQMIKTDIE